LHDPELTQALLCVDELGTALLDFEAHQHGEDLLSPRMVVHQAAGVAMVQLDTTIEEAMARLRATAYAEDVSINALAADVVSGRRRLFKEEP
jgi:AmiR/NasT family two-component response regulator